MNIRDKGMWVEEVPEALRQPTPDAIETLLILRRETYRGFAEIEQSKGFLTPTALLHLPKTQEMVRILFLRGIEESLEAYTSASRDHYLEEMIDAINFWLAVFVLDDRYALPVTAEYFQRGWFMYSGTRTKEAINHQDIVWSILMTMNGVLEKLRNRPWQHNAQSTYFDGAEALGNFAHVLGLNYARVFNGDWNEFVQYYLAKDNVLQFRLRSLY